MPGASCNLFGRLLGWQGRSQRSADVAPRGHWGAARPCRCGVVVRPGRGRRRLVRCHPWCRSHRSHRSVINLHLHLQLFCGPSLESPIPAWPSQASCTPFWALSGSSLTSALSHCHHRPLLCCCCYPKRVDQLLYFIILI